jgi:uncharacterized protein (DUF2235 family)
MAKRLVICCDGTWNRPDQLDDGAAAPTNVSKFALAVARQDGDGTTQLVHYQRGVGTRRFERIRGGAFGLGLSRNVRECYRFLVECYEPGDELYFLGFSRGAFTARSTVGLVRNSGILRPQYLSRIKEAYGLYRARRGEAHPRGNEAALFRRMYSHPEARIHFVGVWDTVGSLGIPIDGVRWPLMNLWSFHDTELSSRVLHAYQAVAIDERRGSFKPTLWKRQEHAAGQTLEQVWFAGVHSDVGGGYSDPALAEIPLLWMVDRAGAAGLAFEPDRLVSPAGAVDPELRHAGVQVDPDALGKIHKSLKSFYLLMPRHRRPLAADGGWLASSAARRRREASDYAPPKLVEYMEGGGREMPAEDLG